MQPVRGALAVRGERGRSQLADACFHARVRAACRANPRKSREKNTCAEPRWRQVALMIILTRAKDLLRSMACLLLLGLGGAGVAAEGRDRLVRIAASSGATPERLPAFPESASFVRHVDVAAASDSHGVEICILEAFVGPDAVLVEDVRRVDRPTRIFEALSKPETLAILNGGFFGLDREGNKIPLGLVVANGRRTSRRHPWKTGGVLIARPTDLAITPIAQFVDGPEIAQALQSKPILVEGGKDGMRGPDRERFDRSAVLLSATGAIAFVAVTEPQGKAATLAEVSRFLLSFRFTDGSGASMALAMDGGPGVHLYVPSLNRHCGSGVVNYVPNAVALRRPK